MDSTRIEEKIEAIAFKKAKERLNIWDFPKFCQKKENGKSLEDVLQSSEKLYSSYIAVMETLIPTNPLGDLIGKPLPKRILSYFALYVGCYQALDYLGIREMQSEALPLEAFSFGQGKITDYQLPLDNLIRYHRAFLEKKTLPLRISQADFLASLKKNIEQESQKPDCFPYTNQLKRINLAINGKVFRGFSCHRLSEADSSLPDFPEEEIVGNELAEARLYGLINRLCLYDTKTKTNISFQKEKPPIIFLYGPPGTGKTLLIKNCLARYRRLAESKGDPFHNINFDNSYKDPFHGVDVKNLLAKFNELKNPERHNLGISDDAEGVWQSRNAWDSSHIETQSMNVVLSELDGLKTAYRGNWMLIFTTNCREKFDPALLSRTTYQIEILGPQKPEQYTRILKKEMVGKMGQIKLSEEEFQKLGQLSHQYRLSGRDLNKIAEVTKDYIVNALNIPPSAFALPPSEQQEALQKAARSVNYSFLEAQVEERYHANILSQRLKQQIEYNAIRSRFDLRLRLASDLFLESLEAQNIPKEEIEKRLDDYQKNFRLAYQKTLLSEVS